MIAYLNSALVNKYVQYSDMSGIQGYNFRICKAIFVYSTVTCKLVNYF